MPEPEARSANVERLKRRSDFRAVADGARTSGQAFVLQARRRSEGGSVRVGFTVSRQVGNAVERNRVRRRLREMVRMSAAAIAPPGSEWLCPGHDYVLVGRRAALAAPFGEMMRDLTTALGRIHKDAGLDGSSSARRGTGGVPPDRLHEAGSRPRRRSGRKPQLTSSPKPLSPRPQER